MAVLRAGGQVMNRNLMTVVVATSLWLMAPSVAGEPEDPFVRQADGIVVHFGVVPAEALQAKSVSRRDARMHGGPSGHPGEQHIVIALFDAATGARIEDARVSAYVVGVGRARSARELEPMWIAGTVTYGTFFSLPGSGPHQIRVEVRRPPDARPTAVSFVYPASN
jgi:hypothetical protein